METILWHLNSRGIYLDSKSPIDIYLLNEQLKEIIGNVTEVVMDEIYDNLINVYYLSLGSDGGRGYPISAKVEKNNSEYAVDRITSLLSIMKGGTAQEQ